jgi:hypothetical protein
VIREYLDQLILDNRWPIALFLLVSGFFLGRVGWEKRGEDMYFAGIQTGEQRGYDRAKEKP